MQPANDALARELAAAADVHAALEAERRALESRDAAALLAAVERKSAAFGRAAGLERERPAGAAAAWRAEPRFAELAELLRRCRRLNDENGALIRGQRRRVDAVLSLLTGSDTGRPTYGPDGAAGPARRSRGPLASA